MKTFTTIWNHHDEAIPTEITVNKIDPADAQEKTFPATRYHITGKHLDTGEVFHTDLTEAEFNAPKNQK